MANNIYTTSHNTLQKHPTDDQNGDLLTAVPESSSAHVTFSARSPSILPTPVYDDTSSIGLFSPPIQSFSPVRSPSASSILSPHNRTSNSHFPPLLNRQIIEEDRGPEHPVLEPKIQVEEESSHIYGEFDEPQEQHYSSAKSPLLTKGFIPLKGNEVDMAEDIQLYETRNRVTPPQFPSSTSPTESYLTPYPPVTNTKVDRMEQNVGRVDMFMNKLRGYRKFTKDSSTRLEQGDSYTQGLVYDQHVQQKQRNMVFRQLFGGARSPLFTWVSGVVMIGVFIYEIVRNHELSGSWIMTNPFNPMVGPNYMALITMGSKFVPCMREIQNYSPATVLGNCYSSLEATCSVEQVCGFGGFRGTAPSQGFRFFTAIFIHAGVVHILMNLVTHFQTGAEVERALGLIRYMILYIVSGIWGFILSAVLAGPTVSSMGCSGALFGIIGYTVIDHLMQWKQHRHPRREFMRIVIVIVISLVLGLLPGLDNFAHIGGLLMGLLLGITLAPFNRHASRRATVIIWTVKILSFVLVIILYAILLSKFYSTTDLSTVCPNCKYLSCLPVNGWCDNV